MTRRKSRLVVACVTVLSVLAALSYSAAASPTPVISATLDKGRVVRIAGSSFAPNTSVLLTFTYIATSVTKVENVTTNQDGAFSKAYAVPVDYVGRLDIEAKGKRRILGPLTDDANVTTETGVQQTHNATSPSTEGKDMQTPRLSLQQPSKPLSRSTVSDRPVAKDANGAVLAPSGYSKLAFADEFDGNAVDWSKWADNSSAEADGGHGNMGNQQLEWNHAKNCAVSNGILTITAKPDSIVSPSGQRYDWSSCLLTSAPSYTFQFGYIEIRSMLPAPKGFWPAFWTWQAQGNDTWTETDVYEFYSDNHERLYMSQHSGKGDGCVVTPPSDATTTFHVYGADIQPSGTTYFIDGQRVCESTSTHTGPTNLIVDMFVYSRIPPEPGTTATHTIDWVRAWEK